MTKRLVQAAVALLAIGVANAEGYQVNTLSARQNGMGHTGVAQKLGAESMIFNPAGMAFMEGDLDFRGSITGIFATAKATLPDGTKFTTDNDPSTPMSFNLGMNVTDRIKAGIGFYTPYGSGINWGENWPGAVLSQSVALKTFTLQPSVAVKILPNLSAGVGAMLTWGSVDLSKGLVSARSLDLLLSGMGAGWPTTDVPASINLQGKASMTAGVNVGLLWDITDQVSVGASFRSEMKMKVKKGEASVTYANDKAEAILEKNLDILNQANFSAEMPCAAVLNVGVAYKPINKLLLAFDAQWTDWSTYNQLDIEFLSPMLTAYNQHLPKKYRDSWTLKLGGEYAVTDRFDVRAGLMCDLTPVNKHHYNPETPGMTKLSPSVGVSFSPMKQLTLNASLLYVAGLGMDNAEVTYTDLLLKKESKFAADYKVHAWNPSVGLELHF